MAQIQPTNPAGDGTGEGADRPAGRRKAVRYGVPVAVAGVAAATIGLVPALADSGAPDLPKITAEELVAKMASSDVDQLSGTVRASTDLGLPGLPSGLGGGGGGPFGGGQQGQEGQHGQNGEGGEAEAQSPAAPGAKLMELASGEHTLRVAADGPEKQRVSIVDDAAEYSLIRNGGEVWAYDSESNSAFHAVAPESADKGKGPDEKQHKLPDGLADMTPKEAAEKALDLADESTSVTVDGTAKVAGRDAYQLVIAPKDAAHSTVGSLRIAVDAENGAPLQFRLMPDEGGEAIVDIAYTEVDFAKPDAGTFTFEPPKGADVTEKKSDGERHGGAGAEQPRNHAMPKLTGGGLELLGEGWGTVAELELPEGDPGRSGDKGPSGLDGVDDPRAQRLLDGFTDKVKGDFGTGRVFETRLVNALITDDGTVYAGAVTKEGLIEAADKADRADKVE
jgi:outer membrane lipoprotein-sorting protein